MLKQKWQPGNTGGSLLLLQRDVLVENEGKLGDTSGSLKTHDTKPFQKMAAVQISPFITIHIESSIFPEIDKMGFCLGSIITPND